MTHARRQAAKGVRLPQEARSKYHARKTTVDGIVFASGREARRYGALKLLQQAGLIRDLVLQPVYSLYAWSSQIPVGSYRADFTYDERQADGSWATIVEDAKGFVTPLYRWKCRHMRLQYGIVIRET